MLHESMEYVGVRHPFYVTVVVAVERGREPFDIVLRRGAAVRGTVRIDGVPAPDQAVRISFPRTVRRMGVHVKTDDAGTYASEGLTPGAMTVSVTAEQAGDDGPKALGRMKRAIFLEDEQEMVVDFDYDTTLGSTVTGRIESGPLPPGNAHVLI